MFKISKLLSFLLGMSGFLRMGVGEEGGGGALDVFAAAEAFSSLDRSGDDEETKQPDAVADETPEAAAERLAAEEAEGEQSEANDETAEPAKFTIKVDGKDVELTEAEVAEHYKNGLRQADYTRKTMEAAEAKKSADAEASKAKAERDRYAQELNNYAIKTHGDIQEQQGLLTEELLNSDPVEYLRQERIFRERQANLAKAQQELQQIGQQQQQEQAEARQSYFQEQQEQLLAKLPEWKDSTKAQAEAGAIKKYLTEQGFTPAECDFTDHRLILLARDAMKHADLLARAKSAVKKVQPLPTKVERSGTADSGKPDGRTAAMKQLGKTGSIDAAANAFAQFM